MPENVRKVVALAQLALEVGVFLAQPIALGVDDALNANRLRHERRHDAEELDRAVELALGLEAEVGAQRADGLAVEQNRHADVADFLARQLRPLGGAPQEHRLARDARHDDRLAALHDASRDALSPSRNFASALPPGGPSEATTSISPARRQQRDGAADDAVMTLENAEHLVQGGLLVRARRQASD